MFTFNVYLKPVSAPVAPPPHPPYPTTTYHRPRSALPGTRARFRDWPGYLRQCANVTHTNVHQTAVLAAREHGVRGIGTAVRPAHAVLSVAARALQRPNTTTFSDGRRRTRREP